MTTTDGSNGSCGDSQLHEIRVQGQLDARWADWLQGTTLRREDGGVTSLTGPPMDQAALHGLLARIRDLGLPILSFRRLCSNDRTQHNEEGETSHD
ncbi:MAG: hypothetical protein ABI577_09600 [bacterium]